MIELFKYKEDCCGCTACKNICPKNAITMKRDEEGFSYPSIDSDLCIECNLCKINAAVVWFYCFILFLYLCRRCIA